MSDRVVLNQYAGDVVDLESPDDLALAERMKVGRERIVTELRKIITDDPTLFVRGLTERLMVFGLGRGLKHYDMPVVRHIVADAKRDNYTFESLVTGVVKSAPFRMRAAPDAAGE